MEENEELILAQKEIDLIKSLRRQNNSYLDKRKNICFLLKTASLYAQWLFSNSIGASNLTTLTSKEITSFDTFIHEFKYRPYSINEDMKVTYKRVLEIIKKIEEIE